MLLVTYNSEAYLYFGITPGIWHNICIAVLCTSKIIEVYVDSKIVLDKNTFDCDTPYLKKDIFLFGKREIAWMSRYNKNKIRITIV